MWRRVGAAQARQAYVWFVVWQKKGAFGGENERKPDPAIFREDSIRPDLPRMTNHPSRMMGEDGVLAAVCRVWFSVVLSLGGSLVLPQQYIRNVCLSFLGRSDPAPGHNSTEFGNTRQQGAKGFPRVVESGWSATGARTAEGESINNVANRCSQHESA